MGDSDFNLDGLTGDSTSGNSKYDIGTLAANASKEVIFTGATWQAGQHTNTATTTGTFTDGGNRTTTKTDTDDANYFGANPSIDVEKYVSGDGGKTWQDADSATGPSILTGNNPQFKFVVTNTGNVALSNVSLSDDKFNLNGLTGDLTSGNSQYDIGALAANASKEVIFTGATWQAGQHTNTATTTGTFTDGGNRTTTKTDTDAANYFGFNPSINIDKVTSNSSVQGDGLLIQQGSAIEWIYNVTNTGNVGLSNVSVNDSDDSSYTGVKPAGARTPGFWKNWAALWDGNASNDSTFKGQEGFPGGDILLAPYSASTTDPVTGQKTLGVLVGDWNRNGVTDGTEKTIFYTLGEAMTIISADQKTQQDKRYTLDRSLVASWLNYLAVNPAPQGDMNQAIQWIQEYTPDENRDGKGDGNLTLGTSVPVPASSQAWSNPSDVFNGLPTGEILNAKLDYYNNTGSFGVQPV